MRAKIQMFDTHQFIKDFKKSGFPEKQAEVLVNVLSKTREADFSQLATKDQMVRVEERLQSEINSVKEQMKHLEEKLTIKVDSTNTLLKWIIPIMLTIVGMVASLMFR